MKKKQIKKFYLKKLYRKKIKKINNIEKNTT